MVASARGLSALTGLVQRGAAFDGDGRVRIGVPAASVLGALIIVDVLRAVFPAGGVFLLLLAPVLVASVACGAASGVLALLLGVVGAGLIAVARAHPWLTETSDVLRIVPYLCIGGFVILTAEVLRSSVRRRVPPPLVVSPSGDLIEPLTDREIEVLALAASGLTTDEIAGSLCLSRNTVKSHLAHAYGKLGVRNRQEAVAMALHLGAIDRMAVTSRVQGVLEA